MSQVNKENPLLRDVFPQPIDAFKMGQWIAVEDAPQTLLQPYSGQGSFKPTEGREVETFVVLIATGWAGKRLSHVDHGLNLGNAGPVQQLNGLQAARKRAPARNQHRAFLDDRTIFAFRISQCHHIGSSHIE